MAKSATQKEVIANSRADIARLLAAVAALGLERFARPVVGEWSAKDVLAHIAAWDRALARGMQELLAGLRPEFASYVEDEFNARTIEVKPPSVVRRRAGGRKAGTRCPGRGPRTRDRSTMGRWVSVYLG